MVGAVTHFRMMLRLCSLIATCCSPSPLVLISSSPQPARASPPSADKSYVHPQREVHAEINGPMQMVQFSKKEAILRKFLC